LQNGYKIAKGYVESGIFGEYDDSDCD
jgi:hypothetical protein